MSALLVVAFSLQALCMLVDEWHFHRKRELPLWERIGHPLDTLTLLSCLSVALWAPPGQGWVRVYVGLAIFSCLWVTKDEWVHTKYCRAEEHWLHSILFLLHPVVLALMGILWFRGDIMILRVFLPFQLVLTLIFLFYQFTYWNLQ